MAANSQYSTNTRFQRALLLPLAQRCSELSVLLEECSLTSFKEIHILFPVLLENVFGFGSHPGWELRNLRRTVQQREFDLIRSFLAPDGVVMRVVYTLMNDVYLKYEFPISCLPTPSCRCLEDGIVPPFYANKIQQHSPGKLPAFLSLNPFEFYVFHFAYFLTASSRSQRPIADWNLGSDSLYAYLIDDYLQYFLPCDGGYPPASPFASSPAKPLGPSPVNNRNRAGSRLGLFGSTSLRNLLKQPAFTRQLSSTGTPQKDVGQLEIWRTEVFVQTLAELWLNQYSVDTYRSAFFSQNKSYGGSPNWSLDSSSINNNLVFSFNEDYFPSIDHLNLVRMLIRHCHYFSNSARANSTNPFDDFKRTIVHQVLQKKLYGFLKHMFDHWPLDASFKVVLEMWLSYIQPWRYTNVNNRQSNAQQSDERFVSTRWQPFVEENIVFYSHFFRKMLPRMLRVELGSSKHAAMLYRLSKVFTQGCLDRLISDAEAVLQEPALRLPSQSSPSRHGGHSVLSRSATDAGHASFVRQHVSDLQGTNVAYAPIFGTDTIKQVQQLLQVAGRSRRELLWQLQNPSGVSGVTQSKGWSLWSWFGLTSGEGDNGFLGNSGSAAAIEAQRVVNHLDYAIAQLSQLFQVAPDQIGAMSSPQSPPSVDRTFQSTDDTVHSNEDSFMSAADSTRLSYQMLSKMRKPDSSFRGNPDLQPIMSHEIAFLVRLFYRISSSINRKYGLEIRQCYEREDFVGHLSRQFIHPPNVASSFAHYGTPSPRRETYLPPRVSLRGLASQQAVGFALCFYGIAYIFKIGIIRATFLGLLFFALYALGAALLQTYFKRIESPAPSRQRNATSYSEVEFLPVTPNVPR